ncbi:MAG: amino acid ABC transporter permease [Nitrospinae bacterium]|nr:amino acid ABC transporter permease [Nitrospinota bacterium]
MSGYSFDWTVITSGKYALWLFEGLKVTLQLSSVSIILAFAIGVLVAVARMSHHGVFRLGSMAYLEFIRNTPLLVQIFFWYFGSYKILPAAFNDWLNTTGDFEFWAAAAGLAIYTSAFIAEDIRSGVRAVPKTQMEAAVSSGFSYLGAMRHVILPQAVRISVPPLIGQFLNLMKNSSLAMTIGVAELSYQARQVESETLKGFEAFTAATLIYLALSLMISAAMNVYRKKYLMAGRHA